MLMTSQEIFCHKRVSKIEFDKKNMMMMMGHNMHKLRMRFRIKYLYELYDKIQHKSHLGFHVGSFFIPDPVSLDR